MLREWGAPRSSWRGGTPWSVLRPAVGCPLREMECLSPRWRASAVPRGGTRRPYGGNHLEEKVKTEIGGGWRKGGPFGRRYINVRYATWVAGSDSEGPAPPLPMPTSSSSEAFPLRVEGARAEQLVAEVLRTDTTVLLDWIAKRLRMGTRRSSTCHWARCSPGMHGRTWCDRETIWECRD